MSFRDDREAAHRRADALEQELKRTQAELEQMRAPRRRGGRSGAAVIVGGVVALAAVGGVFWVVQHADRQRRAELQASDEAARQAQLAADRALAEAVVAAATERGRAAQQPSFAGEVERAGRVTAARGHAPVAAGAQCVMLVRPAWESTGNCRVVLRCGTTWLYGWHAMRSNLVCEVQDGRPVAALDENATNDGGDPRLNWRGRRVVVSDLTGAGEWSVDVAL